MPFFEFCSRNNQIFQGNNFIRSFSDEWGGHKARASETKNRHRQN